MRVMKEWKRYKGSKRSTQAGARRVLDAKPGFGVQDPGFRGSRVVRGLKTSRSFETDEGEPWRTAEGRGSRGFWRKTGARRKHRVPILTLRRREGSGGANPGGGGREDKSSEVCGTGVLMNPGAKDPFLRKSELRTGSETESQPGDLRVTQTWDPRDPGADVKKEVWSAGARPGSRNLMEDPGTEIRR
ncbi:hypothetical protein R1sor_000882 [Riccia sorocarpa]|uniref:Uncharacterized protein n=1 Tax=Riccia sorocarpa TaxID=122646 RepID=A0ABD3GUD9_9MARC